MPPLADTYLENDANLVGYWKLDADANDSKSTNHGTLGNTPSYVAGKFERGIELVRASNQYVTIPDNAAFDFGTAPFTVSCWVKRRSIGIYGGFVSNVNSSDQSGFRLNIDSDDSVNLFVSTSAGVYDTVISTYRFKDLTYFHHLVALRDGTKLRLYIDEIADATTADDHARNCDSGTALVFGPYRSPDLTSNMNDVIIDDVALFNRALSAAEVKDIYSGSKPGNIGRTLSVGQGMSRSDQAS